MARDRTILMRNPATFMSNEKLATEDLAKAKSNWTTTRIP